MGDPMGELLVLDTGEDESDEGLCDDSKRVEGELNGEDAFIQGCSMICSSVGLILAFCDSIHMIRSLAAE